ncbi:phage holin family protein [Rhodospirillaceae bacterium SYSU D60014]|uniref:phage holin family protein n=1 Tax=Virgifigura deserti TaxID=2268457 RepID=UPI000E668FBC
MQSDNQGRSLGSLFAELTRETSGLVRQEVDLAKTEMSEKASQVGSAVASLAVGGALAFAGFLILLQAAVVALSAVMEPWLASLLVGGGVALIGIVLLLKGRSDLKAQNLAPRRTMESVQEDTELARERF